MQRGGMSAASFVVAEFRKRHAILLEDGRGKCAICDKTFKCFRYTKMHIEIKHMPQTKIMCTFCKKFSKNMYSFRNHVQLMHNITGVQNVVETYGVKVVDPGSTHPSSSMKPDSEEA